MTDDVTCYELNRVRDAISSLEHRIADSMLGIPGWTPSPPTYPTEDPTQWDYTHLADEPAQDLPGLGQRLLHLETVVERRYLRQSFYSGAIPTVAQVLGITKSEAKEEEEHKDEEMEDEEKEKMDETDEAKVDMMTTWRVYIQEAIRPSQLMLAVQVSRFFLPLVFHIPYSVLSHQLPGSDPSPRHVAKSVVPPASRMIFSSATAAKWATICLVSR